MGYFAPEPVIGGLDDEQCATSRPASFCHGRVGALKFYLVILSYLRTRDPERILPYVDRGTFVF